MRGFSKALGLAALLPLILLPGRAEDWTTTDGKTYKNVKVLSHNAAYATILDRDGGARVPISTLSPDLKKRFDYDPAKAAPVIAATAAADARDQKALAEEKKKIQARSDRQQAADAAALNAALFSLPPDPDFGPPHNSNAPPSATDVAASQDAIPTEPSTEIDDYDYSDYGDYGYGGYYGSGYGYGYGGYGYRGYHGGWGNHSYGNRRSNASGSYRGLVTQPTVQLNPRH